MPNPPRLLILTAAFGEGHNSAARNLGLALQAAGAEIRVCDPCKLSARHTTEVIEWLYRGVTNYFPDLWAAIYRSTDKADFSKQSMPLMRKPERFLSNLIEDYRPDAIVSSYPIYPYFIARTFAEKGGNVPVFTVVTDSIEINASWLRAPTDHWIVTDQATKDAMSGAGLPPEKIEDTGFPVHPAFAELPSVEDADCCSPFKVLYFPTSRKGMMAEHGRALLDVSPLVRLTIVMGKSTGSLLKTGLELRKQYPGRVHLIGWTRRIPKLLNRHHIVVGKAGGATVHEAIAASCPMLIHHLVPGQEEGNLRLLEMIGCGKLADSAAKLGDTVSGLLENDAAGWRAMKRAVIRHDRHAGALTAARFILERISRKS